LPSISEPKSIARLSSPAPSIVMQKPARHRRSVPWLIRRLTIAMDILSSYESAFELSVSTCRRY
jgi:hypothetical protein